MKTNTVRSWKIGALVAGALAAAVTFNTIRASSEAVTAGQSTAAAAPAAPEGAPVETPPAIPALTPPPVSVSPGMDEIFEMARSGVSDEVLTAFIEKSGRSYQPTAEEIIYLKDLGVSPNTISALIRTGGDRPVNQAATLPARESTEVKTAGTTVNVTTENHYAAAPQSTEPAPQTSVASEPPAEVNLDYFKESLAPYGSWVYVSGIGECWRPTITVVNAGWRPYFDGGRWVYSDAGWYWLSDYSWGWAPFHYGRWHLSGGLGWVWVPGYQWGPAWVTWRTTAAYCGWAPLPAYYGGAFGGSYSYYGSGWGVSVGISWGSYNWVPTRYCYGYYPRYYAAPYQVKQEIYNNSTVIKPTIIGDNNTIIINGPNATAVANASRTEIRRVSARDITNQRDPGPRNYLQNGGDNLASLPATVKPTRDAGASLAAAGNVETRRSAVRSAGNPATVNSAPVEDRRATGGNPARSAAPASVASATETARDSGNSVARNTTTTRVSGQNTTINPSPNYRTPSPQSTPILRNGQTINYSVPVRHTTPVVAGAVPSEITRTTTTYRYPGSSATTYTTSRQTVRTPTVTPNTRPTTQSTTSYAPTRNTTSEFQPNPTVESTRSYRPSTRYTPPSTSAITIPASRPPTRSSAPAAYQAPSRPSAPAPASQPAFQSQSAPSYSRTPSAAPARVPSSPAPSARSSSGAPGRR